MYKQIDTKRTLSYIELNDNKPGRYYRQLVNRLQDSPISHQDRFWRVFM